MLLHELLTSHRDEVLEACHAELAHPQGLDHLARYIAEFFDDIVQLLKPHSPDSKVIGESTAARPMATPVVGSSSAMLRVRIGIDQLSHRSRASVLILGEPGTGKRHCARALHFETYPEGEFFELNDGECLPDLQRRVALLRTHASCAPGLTIFLPEIAEAEAIVQLHLSKLLQERLLQCRIVACSSEGLEKGRRSGKVRPDLLLAFSSKLRLPPLSERPMDIAPLARHFAAQLVTAVGSDSKPMIFSEAALAVMQRYPWPGNVGELASLVERLWHELGPGVVEGSDVRELSDRPSGVSFRLPATGIVFAKLEREVLAQALTMTHNNQSRAAALLGLSRDQLRYRLAKFEISSPAQRE